MDRLNEIIKFGIIAIFMYHVWIGYQRGFIKQAAFIINTIISVVLAPILMPVFYETLKSLDVIVLLEKYIQGFLSAYRYSHSQSALTIGKPMADATIIAADKITMTILEQNAGVIASNIIRATSYSLGFITIRIILHFILNVSAFIAALPIISQFDKAIGALSGGLMTLLSVWVIIALMSLIVFIPGIGEICNFILKVPVVEAFRSINPFELLIKTVEMIK